MPEPTSLAPKARPRASRYRALEFAFCAAFGWVVYLVLTDVVTGLGDRPALLLLVPPIALFSTLTADFCSGLVHWLADTYATRTTPFVGPKFVAPFREHHEDPQAMTRHDFIEANGDNCLLALTVVLPAHLFLPTVHESWATVLSLFALLMSLQVVLTSIIHGWAHRADPPRIVQRLQRAGLILSSEHHDGHHTAPHDKRYCITTGWLNPLLDRTQFFRKMERLLAKLGIHPGADR